MLNPIIIELIENKIGKKISSSFDCQHLAYTIESETGEHLGTTTLKRLFGFTSEDAEPRVTTLDILAKFLGFDSYGELEIIVNNKGDSKFDNNVSSVLSSGLQTDAVIGIAYFPNRRLKLKHVINDEFIVMESINGSLEAGDIIYVDSFSSGLPMIAKDVIRKGERLGRYMAGVKFGIKINYPFQSF